MLTTSELADYLNVSRQVICAPIRPRRMPTVRGKPRTGIGAFGAIRTTVLPSGSFQSMTRLRDWEGQLRRVTATGATRARAEAALRAKLVERDRIANTGEAVTADMEFSKLGALWLEEIAIDPRLADSTKDLHTTELRTLPGVVDALRTSCFVPGWKLAR